MSSNPKDISQSLGYGREKNAGAQPSQNGAPPSQNTHNGGAPPSKNTVQKGLAYNNHNT
ncbi:hypothetical protein Fmac_004931 [Flemingia macrophylla]|uniref:Uncharacterized protein n=1 Tax=Flemingia macrophylla TaxID=520843 RepID=A0ABD1N6B9_9FABA